MFCTKCGAELPPGSKFCTSCGASLEEQKLESTTTPESPPEAEAKEPTQPQSPPSSENQSKSANKTRLIVLICIVVAVATSLVIGYFLLEARKSEYVKTFENSFCVATTDDYPSFCLKNYLGKDGVFTNRQMMKALSSSGFYKIKEETTDSGVTYVTASFTMDSAKIDYILSDFGLEELDNAETEVELRFGFDAGTNYDNTEFIFPIFIINGVPCAQDAGTRELYGYIFQIAAILRSLNSSDPNDTVIANSIILATRTFVMDYQSFYECTLDFGEGTSSEKTDTTTAPEEEQQTQNIQPPPAPEVDPNWDVDFMNELSASFGGMYYSNDTGWSLMIGETDAGIHIECCDETGETVYEIYVTSKNDLVYYDGTSLRFYYDNRSVCLESDSDRILEYLDGQYTDVYF